jgi:GGDEF domain-containing protein
VGDTDLSGEGRFAVLQTAERLLAGARRERVVLRLESDEFCLQVPDSLLETAHFRDHPRVRTADVAE